MKRIDAIIPQSKMSDAFSALKELNIGGFTYFDSKGRGVNPPAAVHSGRGTSLYTPEFNPNCSRTRYSQAQPLDLQEKEKFSSPM